MTRTRRFIKTVLGVGLLALIAVYISRRVRGSSAVSPSKKLHEASEGEQLALALDLISEADDTQIVFEKSRVEYLLDMYGLDVDAHGYVVDEDGEMVMATDGERVHKDNIGYVDGPYDDPEIVRDHISSIMSHVSDRDFRDWDDPRE